MNGDTIRIRVAWSAGELFGEASPFLLSAAWADDEPFEPGERLLVLDMETSARSLGYKKVTAAVEGQGWTDLLTGTSAAAEAFLPGDVFVVRRATGENKTLLLTGFVERAASRHWLPAASTADGEIWIGSRWPEPQAIGTSGLSAAIGITTGAEQGDQLLHFDPMPGDYSAPAAAEIFRDAGGWRQAGTAGDPNFVLNPATGYLIEKRAGFPGAFWVQPPNAP